jgi:hypothetical protein
MGLDPSHAQYLLPKARGFLEKAQVAGFLGRHFHTQNFFGGAL